MAPSLDPALPYLEELVAGFKALCSISKHCVPESEQSVFEDLEAELNQFQKVLKKDKKYTQQQVQQLAEEINGVAERIRRLTNKKEIEKGIREQFARMNGGKDPIDSIDIQVNFDMDFTKKMQKIEALCSKIEEDIKNLKTHAKGRQYSIFEELGAACSKALKVIRSFFNAATHLLHEIKYHGARTANVLGLKERTAKEKEEYWDRREAHARGKKQEAEAERVGMEMLQKKSPKGGKRPRIF